MIKLIVISESSVDFTDKVEAFLNNKDYEIINTQYTFTPQGYNAAYIEYKDIKDGIKPRAKTRKPRVSK